MKLVKDGVIITENNPNAVSVWLRHGFVEADEEEMSEEEIRALAKEKGVTNWHNKKLDNIKAELNI